MSRKYFIAKDIHYNNKVYEGYIFALQTNSTQGFNSYIL